MRGYNLKSLNKMDITQNTSFEVYDSAKRGPIALEELRELWKYRDLVFQLVRRDIVARYKRSVLGLAWTMIQPLGMMLVLTVVFSQLFRQVEGYPVYVLSGLIAWTFFSQTTSAAMSQMVWGGTLLHRIYLPRTSFCVSAIGTGLVNLFLSFVPLILIALILHTSLHASLLFVPVAMVLLAAFALGVSLILSTLAIYFPDVAEMYQVLLVAWMYLTPIIYPESIITGHISQLIFRLNPMYYLVKIFRAPIYEGVLPDGLTLIIGASVSLLVLVVGWFYFTSQADQFTFRT
jgi:ABC-type polysaccharide/polyol phosphate export permease